VAAFNESPRRLENAVRASDVVPRAGAGIMDMDSPVQGPGGVVYPLTHHRAEDVDIDFVLDVDETDCCGWSA